MQGSPHKYNAKKHALQPCCHGLQLIFPCCYKGNQKAGRGSLSQAPLRGTLSLPTIPSNRFKGRGLGFSCLNGWLGRSLKARIPPSELDGPGRGSVMGYSVKHQSQSSPYGGIFPRSVAFHTIWCIKEGMAWLGVPHLGTLISSTVPHRPMEQKGR